MISRQKHSQGAKYNTQTQWVVKPENSLVWHREVLAFINKYSGLDKGASLGSKT